MSANGKTRFMKRTNIILLIACLIFGMALCFASEKSAWFFEGIPAWDQDMDGIPDDLESSLGLDPTKQDSDGNGIMDGDEDFDGDGLSNHGEYIMGTDPKVKDTDGNGVIDGDEDRDKDDLPDGLEFKYNADPFNPDTDGDTWSDGTEVTGGSNPLLWRSIPIKFCMAPQPIKVILPAKSDINSPSGIVLGGPPVKVILPGFGDTKETTISLVLASPPIKIILPGLEETGTNRANTIISKPKVDIILP